MKQLSIEDIESDDLTRPLDSFLSIILTAVLAGIINSTWLDMDVFVTF